MHDATTGLSTCLACHSIPNAKGRNSRCKLRDGTLIDSKHISFALTRHESEPSHKDASKIWLDSRQPQVNSNGRRQGPVPASVILENVPRPVLDTESINSKLAAAYRARNSSRDPITMAALYIGKNCRPARDMSEVCALIQKSSKILGATKEMEQTHHDEHTCAKLLELMSDKLEASDVAQIRASPVLSFGADESVDRGMNENCIIYISWIHDGQLESGQ